MFVGGSKMISSLIKLNVMELSKFISRLEECNTLNVIFQLTDKCVLSCKYCFAKGTHDGKPIVFPDDILEAAIKQAFETHHQYVVFEWTGGEPLLAGISFFEKVVSLQRKYYNKPYANDVQTSANLLDKDLITYLIDNNFYISTTIDGPQDIHNENRPRQDGGESYTRVQETRSFIASKGKLCGFISTITKNNLGNEKRMLDCFAQLGMTSFHSNPYIYYSKNKVKDQSIALDSYDYARYFIAEFNAWVERGRIYPIPRTISDIIKCLERKGPIHDTICTYGGRCLGNFIALTPNGDAYMCPKFTGSYNMRLGNINEFTICDLLSYSSGKMRELIGQRVNAMTSCENKNCKYMYICNGGCPYYSFIASDGENISDTDCLCDGKQILFSYLNSVINGEE